MRTRVWMCVLMLLLLAVMTAGCSAGEFSAAVDHVSGVVNGVVDEVASQVSNLPFLTEAAALPTELPLTPTITLPVETILPPTEAVETPAPVEAATPFVEPTKPEEPTQAPTPEPTKPFGLQVGAPAYISLSVFHSDLACGAWGVAGQIIDAGGNPRPDLVVRISGEVNGQTVDGLGMTGKALNYGPGGYEIVINTAPAASSGTLFLQVFDLNGEAVSDALPLTTYADCNLNLVLVTLNDAQMNNKVYLPIIH